MEVRRHLTCRQPKTPRPDPLFQPLPVQARFLPVVIYRTPMYGSIFWFDDLLHQLAVRIGYLYS